LHPLRADLRLYLRLLGIGLPLAIGPDTLLAFIVPEVTTSGMLWPSARHRRRPMPASARA
jgi:hypothetical protein